MLDSKLLKQVLFQGSITQSEWFLDNCHSPKLFCQLQRKQRFLHLWCSKKWLYDAEINHWHACLSLHGFCCWRAVHLKQTNIATARIRVCVVAAMCRCCGGLHIRNHRYTAASGAASIQKKWANTKPPEWPVEDKEQILLSSSSGHECT